MKNPTALPSAKRISSTLLLVISTLVILSLFGQIIKHVYGHTILKGFVPACCLDYESNVPAWYSSLALGIAGVTSSPYCHCEMAAQQFLPLALGRLVSSTFLVVRR